MATQRLFVLAFKAAMYVVVAANESDILSYIGYDQSDIVITLSTLLNGAHTAADAQFERYGMIS